jgi:hypothetical protein
MGLLLSITGLVKMILMIIGALVLLRFIGQIMQAKRNLAEETKLKERERLYQQQKTFVEKNKGKVHLSQNKSTNLHAEDADFEIIND